MMKRTLLALSLAAALGLPAAVPLRWTVETSRVQPVTFDAVRGESLALEATFKSYGTDLQLPSDAALYYQTNGMGTAWWTVPATVSSNRIAAVFAPTNDPGASAVTGFLGTTGEIFRAAFTLRFRSGPGATPNAVPLPQVNYDIALRGEPTINGTNLTDFVANRTETDPHAPGIVSNIVTKSYVEGLGIAGGGGSAEGVSTNAVSGIITNHVESGYLCTAAAAQSMTNAGAVAAAKAYTDSNAYPKTSGDTLAAQVATIGGHLNAEDARFVATNYNSATRIPEAYVEVKQSNAWLRVWSEMTRWDAFAGSAFDWDAWSGFHTWSTNITAQLDEKSPRQYAFFDGVTGEAAPDDFFWISQPHVAVCAGAGYQRYMDGAHEVWVLESNGMVADINGTTNGYFRITDSEGDTQFEIIKGDKQTVFANAYAMTMTNVNGVTHYYTTYAVTNAVAAPTARISVTGPASGFVAEGSSCPANVSWTAGQNCYILEWWPKSSYDKMFVKCDYERGGDTIIRNNAPVQMQTIYIGGKKFSLSTTTINGETVLKLTEVQ